MKEQFWDLKKRISHCFNIKCVVVVESVMVWLWCVFCMFSHKYKLINEIMEPLRVDLEDSIGSRTYMA